MSNLIDRQAAIDAAKHAWAKGLEPSQYIEELPSAQPTLYGYNIENLAMIARVMQKEGVTPEDAMVIFRDVRYMYKMLLEEIQEGFEKAFLKEG